MTGLLARLLVWLTFTMVRLLLFAVRLVLWLFALVGFRGARLVALMATVAGVRWAAQTVGVGPAVRLAVIGWAAWAVRHHRAAIRRSAVVRRLTAAMEGYAAELAAATKRLQRPVKSKPRPTRPRPGPAQVPGPRPGRAPGLPLPLPFEPSRLEAVARYVVGRWGARPAARTGPAPHPALVDRRKP
jgi:hypothetical protein